MSNGGTNIDRLKTAKLVDDTYLTKQLRDNINKLSITDQEIQVLKDFKDKLGLLPIQLGVYVEDGGVMGGV